MTLSYLPKLTLAFFVASTALGLTACDNSNDEQANTQAVEPIDTKSQLQQHADIFAGCYTVSHDEPAQIKVSLQQQGLVMQMKEPASANRVWDDPEPLNVLSLDEVPNYFSIDKKNTDALIGRPDKMFVVAHVKQAYANIDPLLDSQYLGYIVQGANTIFKVECDEVHSEELPEDMSNISVKPAGQVQVQ